MSAKVFLDTNILVYVFAAGDARSDRAEALVVKGGAISVQVLNEFANVCSRKLALPWKEIAARLATLRALLAPPRAITVATHEAALKLAAAHKLSFFDALVVASAKEMRCGTLYSEDMQHERLIEGVRIINPFRES
jgi:predicted nucleic acid-binding protein